MNYSSASLSVHRVKALSSSRVREQEQVADAHPQLTQDLAERPGTLLRVLNDCWIGDAPVRLCGVARERGADITYAVTDGDDIVQWLADVLLHRFRVKSRRVNPDFPQRRNRLWMRLGGQAPGAERL